MLLHECRVSGLFWSYRSDVLSPGVGSNKRRKASAEQRNNFTLNLKRGQGSNDGQRKKLEGNSCF